MLTDGPPDGDHERSRDGIDIVAELRARATQLKSVASDLARNMGNSGLIEPAMFHEGSVDACEQFLEWLDELNGCDPASSDEAGIRNS